MTKTEANEFFASIKGKKYKGIGKSYGDQMTFTPLRVFLKYDCYYVIKLECMHDMNNKDLNMITYSAIPVEKFLKKFKEK